MRRVEKSVLWAVLLVAGMLSGCATAPQTRDTAAAEPVEAGEAAESEAMDTDDTAGMAEASMQVERASLAELAEARGEIDMAMTDIRMAEARGMLLPEAHAWVEQARKALAERDAEQARKLAAEAGAQARMALDGYYADMAQQRIAALRKDYSNKMSSAQRMRLESAESALKAGKAEVALMLVSALVDEVAPNAVFESRRRSDGKLTRITVREGDTLSSIAARPDVYGNADLWPLLLKANRDKFLRVDELPVGIELVIPRNVSQDEIEQAMAQAR